MTDDTQAAPATAAGAAAPPTDHTADLDGCCTHSWCRAHPTLSRDAGHSGDHHAGKPGAWRRTMADVIGVADPDNRRDQP